LSGTQVNQLILDNPEKLDELRLNAEIIEEQVIRGSKLVSNVRKLSKLEDAGRSLEKIEILNVLKNTVSFLKKSYKDKNLAIRVDSIGEKLFIKANIFLEDVFENLLINAIRHNKNLIIEITVRISRERKVGISYLKMEFMDNGVGVADSMKEKIFQRGYSKEKGVYGMGLGLSLVRGIIETYNGRIRVEDRVKGDRSKGCNFVLLIPEVD
jgi:signal transduction histidine kinase